MKTEFDTFAAIRYGYFTAEDIRRRWLTGDRSKFISLPLDIKVHWMELLCDRYADKVSNDNKKEFIEEANVYIDKARYGHFSSLFNSLILFFNTSFFFSINTFISPVLYSHGDAARFFTDEVMRNLEMDVELLNKAIREYIER
jgi:hypothetical protein